MHAMAQQLRRHAGAIGVTVIALAASALIATLGREVNVLDERAARYRGMLRFPHEGQWVPTVLAPTLSGDSVTIGEAREGSAQIMVAFGASCPYSLRSLPQWKRLMAALRADSAQRFEAVWVSISPRDSTERYVTEHALDARVALPPDPKMVRIYKIRATPVTTVIDHRGRVAYAHVGEFTTPGAVDSVLSAARRAAVARSVTPAPGANPTADAPLTGEVPATQPRRSQ